MKEPTIRELGKQVPPEVTKALKAFNLDRYIWNYRLASWRPDDSVEVMATMYPELVKKLRSIAPKTHRIKRRTWAHLERRNPRFTWDPYIPEGMLTAITGDSGSGKTWFFAQLAAAATSGKTLPSGIEGQPPQKLPKSPIILIQREMDEQSLLLPRFEDLGGDKAMVVAPAEGFGFGPYEDHLEAYLRLAWYIHGVTLDYGRKPAFVYIDPIKGVLAANANKDDEVRPTLERLNTVAGFFGVPIIYVIHLNKSTEKDVIHRLSGSQEFFSVPRSVLVMQTDPDGSQTSDHADLLAFHQKKVNVTGKNLAFSVDGTTNPDDSFGPLRFNWKAADQASSAQDLAARAAQEARNGQRGPTKRQQIANELLKNLVAMGTGKEAPRALETSIVKGAIANSLDMASLPDSSYRRSYADLPIKPFEPVKGSGEWYWPAIALFDEKGERMDSYDVDDVLPF
jgi:hypothetical protein